MNHPLSVRGLCKRYDTFSLKEVSFDVPAGYITGFIGPNGAGKTTTLKAALNLIRFDAGQITLFGHDVRERAADGNDSIGVVMDAPFFVEDWTVADVARAVAPFYAQWDAARYASLLERFELEPGKKVRELSRGMKVKLMLAAALSHDARLLILDEPTSGLDPVARDELCDLLAEFVTDEGRSVLFSTHITSDLEKIADYITVILNGEIAFTGTKDDLTERYVRVMGGREELSAAQRSRVLGLREHGTGFEGLAEASFLASLPGTLVVEPATLDEIVIFMNRGAKEYA